MYVSKDAIVDVPINKKLETDLVKCFMDESDYVLICSYGYTDEEIQYLKILKEKHEYSIEISNKLNSEIKYGQKPCTCELISHYSQLLKKNVVRRFKWFKAQSKKEIETIIYDAENIINYKLRVVLDEIDPNNYKYKLDMYEHYFADDDESQEFRSLCFEVGEGYRISNRVISNINKIILKYNLEIQR